MRTPYITIWAPSPVGHSIYGLLIEDGEGQEYYIGEALR